MSEEKDQLDRLLDSALTHYGRVEPRSGLEGRLLAGIEAEARAPLTTPTSWWKFATAGVLAALVIVGLFGIMRSKRFSQLPAPIIATTHGSNTTAPVATSVTPQEKTVARRVPRNVPNNVQRNVQHAATSHPQQPAEPTAPLLATASAPRKPTFPAMDGLSEQERLLLQYMRRTPVSEIVAQAKPEDPVLEMNKQMTPQRSGPRDSNAIDINTK